MNSWDVNTAKDGLSMDKKTKLFIKQTILVIVVSLSLNLFAQDCTDSEEWITLFNGKDLTGWTPKICGYKLGEDPFNTFRVVDGLLTVSYDKYPEEGFKGQFGHLFYKTPFSAYRVKMEFRFIGEQLKGGPGWAKQNSGIMLHCLPPESMEVNTKFPTSIEFQFLGDTGNKKRVCGSLFLPGNNIVTYEGKDNKKSQKSKVKALPLNEWVTAEAVVKPDGTIQHFVNGELAIEYSNPRRKDGTPIKEGYISVQSETHPVQFRNIKILKLK